MYRDEIIAEVWRLREEYVARHNHDLSSIVADLKVRQKRPHGKLVDRRDSRREASGAKPGMQA
jgi:hypothetical protein